MAQLKSEYESDDEFDYEDSCDICVKGYSKANEFGRCRCRCYCKKLMRVCRYSCDEWKAVCAESAKKEQAKFCEPPNK